MIIEQVTVPEGYGLKEYAGYAHLAPNVEALTSAAAGLARPLSDRTVWMVSSTRQGGGVAEGLPRVVSLLRQLGVRTEWLVIEGPDRRFFQLTKRIHNRLHGFGEPGFGPDDHDLYRKVSADFAAAMRSRIAPEDLLVVHDPQPLAVGAILKRELGLPAIWRCHIGLDRQTPATEDAWSFLRPFATVYD
ncbi:MAG TPA: glycosyl transferase family 1, partial [Alphaproteobacteria bacterium]|nr:glycosyl transferase family 1 [Alphaproteobacteria bacterium]